jgi:hypothetical protein
VAERRAAEAARQQALRRQERFRRLAYVAAGIVAVVLVVLGRAVLTRTHAPTTAAGAGAAQIVPATPTGAVTVQRPPTPVADHSGIDGVLAWDTGDWPGAGTSTAPGILEHQHVSGPVTYALTPPVGGPHDAVWMNAGVYTLPIPAERAVHNLEHGAVWLTYRPDLPAAQVAALTAFVGRQSLIDESGTTHIAGQRSRYVDLSPWTGNGLPAPIVISAWGHQLRVTSAADPRLQRFVDVFRNSRAFSPEYGSPVDGVPVQTGGRPASDGATEPNPAGAAAAGAGMPGG